MAKSARSDFFKKSIEFLNTIWKNLKTKKICGYFCRLTFMLVEIDKLNLSKPSFVQADNIHTVPKKRLEKFIGTLDSEIMAEISKKVVLALELENCMHDI